MTVLLPSEGFRFHGRHSSSFFSILEAVQGGLDLSVGWEWKELPSPTLPQELRFSLHIFFLTGRPFSARSIYSTVACNLQNGLGYLKHRRPKGTERVDGTVLIMFPSPSYFPRVVTPGHDLIWFLLLLITLLSSVLLKRIPTQRGLGRCHLISSSWAELSLWGKSHGAIELLSSNFHCSIFSPDVLE